MEGNRGDTGADRKEDQKRNESKKKETKENKVSRKKKRQSVRCKGSANAAGQDKTR